MRIITYNNILQAYSYEFHYLTSGKLNVQLRGAQLLRIQNLIIKYLSKFYVRKDLQQQIIENIIIKHWILSPTYMYIPVKEGKLSALLDFTILHHLGYAMLRCDHVTKTRAVVYINLGIIKLRYKPTHSRWKLWSNSNRCVAADES